MIHQVPYTEARPLALRQVNQELLSYWLPYMTKKMLFNVTLNDNLNVRIEPYYGSIFNEYDIIGQNFAIDVDYGSDEQLSVYIPNNILNLILGSFLNPLLPEHFDNQFVCNILEIILIDTLTSIKEKTGIMPKFQPFAGLKGDFKSFWRLYVGDDNTYYPLMIIGKQGIISDLLRKLFSKASFKKSVIPLVELKIISFIRKMSLSQLRNLKIGEIIILLIKRHPINEPLVIIGNRIVCHTVLNDMELHLTQDPTRIQDVEEFKMTVHDDDIDAIRENHTEEFDSDSDDYQESSTNTISDALNDLKVTVTFELNRMEMSTQAVSQLREGSVLNLQKQITEDVYLTISGRTIAVGEVVQVGRNFGVLIKEIL